MFNWFSFLAYALSSTITPGPNNIMSMSNGSRMGFRKSLPFNFGILIGFSFVMIICTAFCSLLSAFLPAIKLPMMIAGAIYMLFLAWKIFTNKPDIEENHSRNGLLAGLLLQFVNPKIYIYGIMSMQAYILPYYSGHYFKLFSFAILMALIGATCNLCWSAFGSVFKLLFSKHAKIVNSIMALLLVYCAVSLFL